MDAAGDGIVGADETCGRSAVGPDAQRLGHRLLHYHLGIGIELLNNAQRRILRSKIEKVPVRRVGLLVGIARNDERGQSEPQRCTMARAG
jgi:hypothetical protein